MNRQQLAGRVWRTGALACAALMHGLRAVAAILEGVARVSRRGAQQLERAATGARARVNRAPAAEPPAPAALAPVPAGDQTVVAPADKTIMASSDKTIVSASPFLVPPPRLPPPRPQWGRGPSLPPPRRAEWRAAMEAKTLNGEGSETTPPAGTAGPRSDS